MRKVKKLSEPTVLATNKASWTADYARTRSQHHKTKYRERSIKEQVVKETFSKCVYCESKVGATTPGDIEHKIPLSKVPSLHFEWSNLTLACTECNRRKGDYYEVSLPFLDPYDDDVEAMLEHLGPIVSAKPGCDRAEYSVKRLDLNNTNREELVKRKTELLAVLSERRTRLVKETNPVMKELISREIKQMAEKESEYSAMIRYILRDEL